MSVKYLNDEECKLHMNIHQSPKRKNGNRNRMKFMHRKMLEKSKVDVQHHANKRRKIKLNQRMIYQKRVNEALKHGNLEAS